MNFTFDTGAAILALLAAVSTFAVMHWRVGDLERRVEKLENQQNKSDVQLAKLETEIKNVVDLLTRIATKLGI